MRAWASAVALCAWLLPGAACAEVSLVFAGQALQVEVAATATERQRGLMERDELGESRGMLFIFPETARQCLWMKNTWLPLSAAFLDEARRVINIVDLHPGDLQLKCSRRPARYAVEANQGWFKAQGVRPGDRVEGLPGQP
ncbi:DUF192 domain-containing protein [Stutzerimonas tarimensis]|uniref:DUF192 domain-containing protein n=1 Tax=Stutzerimonas tarimensis TaxID=1507735 RepID=A0ABV7T6G9_9GAMM